MPSNQNKILRFLLDPKEAHGQNEQEGIRVKLPAGATWDQLASMSPAEIRDKTLFPKGFYPLPHPNFQKVGQRPRRRHIIRQIKAEKIPAIFLENISDPRLMKRIAAETGAKIGGALYSDALSPSDAQQCQGTFRCACAIGRT